MGIRSAGELGFRVFHLDPYLQKVDVESTNPVTLTKVSNDLGRLKKAAQVVCARTASINSINLGDIVA